MNAVADSGLRVTIADDAWSIAIPMRTQGPNGGHDRQHWSKTNKARKTQRTATLAVLRCYLGTCPFLPATIVITRVGKGNRKMDTDNVATSTKGLRDAVAQWLGIDDGDERVDWVYRSRLGQEFAVEIRMMKAVTP